MKKLLLATMLVLATALTAMPTFAEVCVDQTFYDKVYATAVKTVWNKEQAILFLKKANVFYKTTFSEVGVEGGVVYDTSSRDGLVYVFMLDAKGCKILGGYVTKSDYDAIMALTL